MNSLLLRRRMMMAQAIPTERLVYSLSNYTCDGTANTFIDTGIRLFSPEYEAFRIELEYDNFDLETQVNNETILECKSNSISWGGGTAPGMTVRAGEGTTYGGHLRVTLDPRSTVNIYGALSSATVSIIYTGGNDNSIVVDGSASIFSGSITPFPDTFTIGGRGRVGYSPDRFVTCHISSLKVYVTPAGTGGTIYSLRDYTCDGTAATAINTGRYLFDQTMYPTGWMISFDFTVGENNPSLGSYLRCRNAGSPYPGFGIRRNSSNASQAQAQINGSSKLISAAAGTRHSVIIANDLSKVYMYLDGGSSSFSQSTPTNVISPLVIGGELSNDTTQAWNTSRFGKIYIHSLIVKAL